MGFERVEKGRRKCVETSSVKRELKAPFPYFGGKSSVAQIIWRFLGNVPNYIEPFCGSAAVLLARPRPPKVETINDLDCYVANFWRATGQAPEEVASLVDWPVNEADLHARHRWLVSSDEAVAFRQKMRKDPDYYDSKIAGWWCWGACCWIGSGWCVSGNEEGGSRVSLSKYGAGCVPEAAGSLSQKRPVVEGGRGVDVKGRPQLADKYSRGRGVHGNDSASLCEERRAWLVKWFISLRDRLRTVRVCCGDWLRVCESESVTTRLGTTGIFFDPPYGEESGRTDNLYSTDSMTVASDVRKYCLERGSHRDMRIVLAGYAGEGHEELESKGWKVVAWKPNGGYGNRSDKGKENARKERLWVSPHCIQHKVGFFPDDGGF